MANGGNNGAEAIGCLAVLLAGGLIYSWPVWAGALAMLTIGWALYAKKTKPADEAWIAIATFGAILLGLSVWSYQANVDRTKIEQAEAAQREAAERKRKNEAALREETEKRDAEMAEAGEKRLKVHENQADRQMVRRFLNMLKAQVEYGEVIARRGTSCASDNLMAEVFKPLTRITSNPVKLAEIQNAMTTEDRAEQLKYMERLGSIQADMQYILTLPADPTC